MKNIECKTITYYDGQTKITETGRHVGMTPEEVAEDFRQLLHNGDPRAVALNDVVWQVLEEIARAKAEREATLSNAV